MLLKTEAPKIYISFCLPDGISAFWPREKGLRSGSWEVGRGLTGSSRSAEQMEGQVQVEEEKAEKPPDS